MSTPATSEFVKLIQECRETKSTRLIYNASIEHARDLFVELFKEAEEIEGSVNIVSGFLTEDFYNQFSDTVKRIIAKGIPVRLAVLDPEVDLKKHAFATSIKDSGGKLFQSDRKIKTPHYILVGDRGFRLETDHDNAKAVASFNNPEIAKMLNVHFHNFTQQAFMKDLTQETTETTNPQ